MNAPTSPDAAKVALRREIGARLRTLRTSAGFTQAQLAEAAGVDRGAICWAERGKAVPRRRAMEALAAALKAPDLTATAERWYDAQRAAVAQLGRANRGRHRDRGALDHVRAALRADSKPREIAAEASVTVPTVRRWMRDAGFNFVDARAPASPRRPTDVNWRERAAESLRATAIRRADTKRSRLTARRVALGLTIQQLSERVGIHIARLCSLETGYVSPRSTHRDEWRASAARVADYLWTTCEDLWPQHVPAEPRLPRPEAPARPDELYEAAETAALIRAAVLRLTPQQALTITVRFGLDGGGEGTQHDAAAMLGVTHQRVSQVEKDALARLATLLKEHRP